jgi:hypothetical protein
MEAIGPVTRGTSMLDNVMQEWSEDYVWKHKSVHDKGFGGAVLGLRSSNAVEPKGMRNARSFC